ncbi:MAG: M36 family metallopeptidase [Gammaproteobacteria bacterium]|nr:M36 family metallopeptidase [Gammaproteobacteria bacterium]
MNFQRSLLASLVASSLFALHAPIAQAQEPALGFKLSQASDAAHSALAASIQRDAQTGLPRFVWANPNLPKAPVAMAKAGETSRLAGSHYLAKFAPLYGLDGDSLASARLERVHDTGSGPIVLAYGQAVDGIEVFRSRLALTLDREHRLVSLSGNLSADVGGLRKRLAKSGGAAAFGRSPAQSAATAFQRMGGALAAGDFAEAASRQGYRYLSAPAQGDYQLRQPARVKPVYFPVGKTLIPAHYVELKAGQPGTRDSDYLAFVVGAADGRILFKKNLSAKDTNFAYRVFADADGVKLPWDGPQERAGHPHPTGLADNYKPGFRAPQLVTLSQGPISKSDPWLREGSLETRGNNVDAYVDQAAGDGYTAGQDLRATVNSLAGGVPGFDYSLDTDKAANADDSQKMAAATEMFYVTNWLHDWFYDAGFDEAAGNAQLDNYGRGGQGGDPLLAEAQDYSGSNNANMGTPADGESPVMQMFVYFHEGDAELSIQAPGGMGPFMSQGAAFGPEDFDLSAELVEMTPTLGCENANNPAALAGKIAVIDRGTCQFSDKVANAQAAGAVGALVVNNADSGLPGMSAGDRAGEVTIPSFGISKADGTALRAALAGGAVRVRMLPAKPSRDSSFDALTIAHEWGHYITNRLIGDGAGLDNNQGGSMGEGWGDFIALLMTTEARDLDVASNAGWNGVYGFAGYSDQGRIADNAYYEGIRGFPYTTDMAKNPLSFRHIEAGVPRNADDDGENNAEVHASGTVWASMLWECYTALLRDHPFAEAQKRMKNYLVASLKATPASPTFIEARDALMAAAKAGDAADYGRFAQAFAKRGMGAGAEAPDRYSGDHVGVVESFSAKGGATIEVLELDHRGGAPRCDADEALDAGETSVLKFAVRNSGFLPLNALKAQLSSTASNVVFANGGELSLPALQPGQSADGEIAVTLPRAGVAENLKLTLRMSDPDMETAVSQAGAQELEELVNYDLAANATRDPVPLDRLVNASTSTSGGDIQPWLVAENPLVQETDYLYFGPNPGVAGENQLLLPAFTVAADDKLALAWQQAFGFEADSDANYDGGVVEYRVDGGAWQRADAGLSPAYNGRIDGGGNVAGMEGQLAYVGRSEDFPALANASLNLTGKGLAGKRVEVRFRIGADRNTADMGWLIDNLEVTGASNTPFQSPAANAKSCAFNNAPMADAGADKTVAGSASVELDGSASRDIDGDALSYAWTQTAGTPVTLSDAATAKPRFTAPATAGGLRFKLSVTDALGKSGEDEVAVTVNAATPRSGGGGGGSFGWLLAALPLLRLRRR